MTRDQAQQRDLYESVTQHVIAAIEKGAGDFQMPWHQTGGSLSLPVNVVSQNRYNGINVVMLWGAARVRGYETPVWGTFKQWLEIGCPVRKGERSVPGIFYKELRTEEERDGRVADKRIPMARSFALFNAAQVEGYDPPEPAPLPDNRVTPIESADALIDATGAIIEEAGQVACYHIATDKISIPARARFTGTETSSPTGGFYGVLLHELTHWTGAKRRLDRNLTDRFKADSVALEELVAELGSAMLCAALGVSQQPRLDHARYIAGWLEALHNDKKAIFVASSAAQKAADYLQSFNPYRPLAQRVDESPEP